MNKKIVCLDTSYFRRHHNDLKNHYSPKEWLCAISEKLDLELNRDSTDSKIRKSVFLKNLELKRLKPQGMIIQNEVNGENIDVVVEKELQRNVQNVTSDEKIRAKLDSRAKGLVESNDTIWENIAKGNASIKIDSKKFIKDFFIFLKDDNILQKNGVERSIIDLLFDMEEFQKKYPGTYNSLKILYFYTILVRKPTEKKQFTVYINDKPIVLKKSFLTDLEICAVYLPYISEFVSCDEPQINLLKFLFPEYKTKLKYFVS